MKKERSSDNIKVEQKNKKLTAYKSVADGGFNNQYKSVDGKYHPHLTLGIIKFLVRPFFKKPEIVWKTEIPEEPVLYVSNHTKIYAPTAMLLYFKNIRLWVNCYFLNYKDCWNHMLKKVLKDRPVYFNVIFVLVMPLLIHVFKSFESIPVFHDMRVKNTINEFCATIESGKSSMIFPERTENPVNEYVYEYNKGFVYTANTLYRRTGYKLKFYPVYCAEKLKKVLIGEPIEYNPDIPIKEQSVIVCDYLQNKIKELGDSLGEHEIVFYG